MKIHAKKKAFQKHCQVMADAGKIPTNEGVWVPSLNKSIPGNNRNEAHFQNGRRVGRKR